LTRQIFTYPSPSSQFFLRARGRPISAQKLKATSKYLKRFSEIARLKLTAGERFCEDLSCQKARVGEGRELERALVDVTGTGKTVPSCREKQFEEKRLKRRLNSPTVVKVFENKFDRVVEKSFESVFLVS